MCKGIVKQHVDHPEKVSYLEEQILTYLGNKRMLLNEIGSQLDFICQDLGKTKLVSLDLFSGSGIVARYLKQYSSCVYANDLEMYSRIINECYLSNESDFDRDLYLKYLRKILSQIKKHPIHGIIRNNYSPKDDSSITSCDRVFYTNENAVFIDSVRYYVDLLVPEYYRNYFLARLLIESSVHVNTAGIFKGFYKDRNTGIGKFGGSGENALVRIKGKIDMSPPILSNYHTDFEVFQKDANDLAKVLKDIDVAYLDPPYNQHPYGSNYFMLNIIAANKINAPVSDVSGIPSDWNRSNFNKKQVALLSLEDVVSSLDAKYLIVSYNNEGFISFADMKNMLTKYGVLKTVANEYNTFRGSRNLNNRSLKTVEYLFVLKKS